MAFNIDKTFGIFDDALALRARRGEVLASNLVNADTPGYKARDFDFQAALNRATDPSGGPMKLTHANHMVGGARAMTVTHANHLSLVRPGTALTGDLDYRAPSQPSLDGNTVDVEREKSEFAENALHYQASLRFLSGKIKSLNDVLKGSN